MATIDTSYVRTELKAIIATSKAVAKLVYNALDDLESDPGQFDLLDEVPKDIRKLFPTAIFRKVYIEHNPHNFRLVIIHWRIPEREDHVDVIYAFPRKDGYPIDWEEVAKFAESEADEQ